MPWFVIGTSGGGADILPQGRNFSNTHALCIHIYPHNQSLINRKCILKIWNLLHTLGITIDSKHKWPQHTFPLSFCLLVAQTGSKVRVSPQEGQTDSNCRSFAVRPLPHPSPISQEDPVTEV